MSDRTALSKKMVARADADGLPEDHALRTEADALDRAANDETARKLLGAWARARRVWCDYTGEPLL